MIWTGGRVVEDDALKVDIRDRAFEHGLGLFETLRTYGGRAPLLDGHLARMRNSAQALGIPLDPAALPDDASVAALLDASGAGPDVLLRITLTGGLNEVEGSTLWMRTGPLPPPLRHGGAVVDLGSWNVAWNDPIARHKCLNYWVRRTAFERARALGYDETLSTTHGGKVWEGSRTNLFLVVGESLITPPLEGPIVPGIMLGVVIRRAQSLAWIQVTTREVTRELLDGADEVFLTNSVRGIIPVARIGEASWPAPGPWTQRLTIGVNDWLEGEGEEAP